MTRFAVITEIPEDSPGNYACSELIVNPNADRHCVGANLIVNPPQNKQWEKMFAIAIRLRDYTRIVDLRDEQLLFCITPVFALGEILVLDANDRSIPDGRKPGKWDVSYEVFNNIEDAIACSKRVCEGLK